MNESDRYAALQEYEVSCPWCWQAQHVLVDCSQGEHGIIEDCSVCCHPMELTITLGGGALSVQVERGQ